MTYCVQAYIRKLGELVESVCLDVRANSEYEACEKVKRHYEQMGLTAGINTESIHEMIDFDSLVLGV